MTVEDFFARERDLHRPPVIIASLQTTTRD
jgi:hypothetical protein